MTNVPGLMDGKRGLVMGVANDHSIAWGIAKTLAAHGATLAFTYQGDALGRRVKPLAESVGSSLVLPCDVEQVATVDAVFSALAEKWGSLDFLVHAIAFSDKNELKGRYADTSRENFIRTMVISCFSFTEVAKRAAMLMPAGGAMVTLTYNGGQRAMPNYNVMGVAKAALESTVRYLAYDLGPDGIRVNALSPGPIPTVSAVVIEKFDNSLQTVKSHAPLLRNVTPRDVGNAAVFYAADISKAITGATLLVDAGMGTLMAGAETHPRAGRTPAENA